MHACDRQTDGRTDGQTEISSQYRGCITCSAVKTCTLMSRSRPLWPLCQSREIQTSRLGLVSKFWRLVSAGKANVSVSSFYVSCPSRARAVTNKSIILLSMLSINHSHRRYYDKSIFFEKALKLPRLLTCSSLDARPFHSPFILKWKKCLHISTLRCFRSYSYTCTQVALSVLYSNKIL